MTPDQQSAMGLGEVFATISSSRRLASKVLGVVVLVELIAQALVWAGGRWISPGENVAGVRHEVVGVKNHVDSGFLRLDTRIDSTNSALREARDSATARRQDREILDRATQAFLCDYFSPTRQRDLRIFKTCDAMKAGR